MKKVPSVEVKKRSRELTTVFESFSPYQEMKGQIEKIWITEIATDGIHLVTLVQPFYRLQHSAKPLETLTHSCTKR
jgi:hypothetical protein